MSDIRVHSATGMHSDTVAFRLHVLHLTNSRTSAVLKSVPQTAGDTQPLLEEHLCVYFEESSCQAIQCKLLHASSIAVRVRDVCRDFQW